MTEPNIPTGGSRYWNMSAVDPSGADFDLTGCAVWMMIKPTVDADATDTAAVLTHKIVFALDGSVTAATGIALGGTRANGTAGTTAAHGCLTDHLTPSESRAIHAGGYVYDLVVKDANGDVWFPILSAPLVFVGHVLLEAL